MLIVAVLLPPLLVAFNVYLPISDNSILVIVKDCLLLVNTNPSLLSLIVTIPVLSDGSNVHTISWGSTGGWALVISNVIMNCLSHKAVDGLLVIAMTRGGTKREREREGGILLMNNNND